MRRPALGDSREELGPHRALLAEKADRRPVRPGDQQLRRARMGRVDQDATVPERRRVTRQADAEFVRALQVPGRRTQRPEDLEPQRDASADRHAAGLEHAVRPVREREERGRGIFDVDRLAGTIAGAGAAPPVADRVGRRERPFRDERRRQALHLGDLPDQEAQAIDEVVPGVDRDPPASEGTLEAPQERHVRIGGVVEHERRSRAPDVAELASVDQGADRSHGRVPPVGRGEPVEHARGTAGIEELVRHLRGLGQRLLADHVLSRRGGGQHHLAIEDGRQAGDDHVDVGRLHDATPVAIDALIAEPISETRRERLVDVRDGDQPRPKRQRGIQRPDEPEGGAVHAGHGPGADHRDADRRRWTGHGPTVASSAAASSRRSRRRRQEPSCRLIRQAGTGAGVPMASLKRSGSARTSRIVSA